MKSWHFLAGWAALFAVSVPVARSARHLNQPPVTQKYEVGRVERADVGHAYIGLDRVRGKNTYPEHDQWRTWGGGEVQVVLDATDETMRLEVVYQYEHSLFRETTETHPVRSDLVLHVNPKGKYPTPGNPDVWVTEAQVKREAFEKALYAQDKIDRAAALERRKPEMERLKLLTKEADDIKERWLAEDEMRRAFRRMFAAMGQP